MNKDYIFLSAPIKLVERLFRVKVSQYFRVEKTRTGTRGNILKSIYRATDELHIPDYLSPVVEAVFGVSDFPPPAKGAFEPKEYISLPSQTPLHYYTTLHYTTLHHTTLHYTTLHCTTLLSVTDNFPLQRRQVEEPGSNVTPQVIKSLYKIGNRVGGSKLSSQAVAEFEQAYFYPSDILEFEKLYNLPIQPIAKIIGPNDPENGYLGEATLDTEYIIGVGTNIPSWVTTNLSFVVFVVGVVTALTRTLT